MSSTNTQKKPAHQPTFESRYAASMLFLAREGRRPSSGRGEEQALYAWIRYNLDRLDRGGFDPTQSALLQELKELYESTPGAARWLPPELLEAHRDLEGISPQVARVVAFFRSKGRLPKASINSENSFYYTLRSVRTLYHGGSLSDADRFAFDSVPGASTVVRKDPLPVLAELVEWCTNQRRLPRHTVRSATTTAEHKEQSLGQWMYRHVHRRHEPVETEETVHIRDTILGLRETYLGTQALNEDSQARAILQFVKREARLPDVLREYSDYDFLAKIRTKYRHGGRMGPATAQLLREAEGLPDYLESQWSGWYSKLEAFVAANGCLPDAHTSAGKRSPEARLARWVEKEPRAEGLIAEKMARAA